MNAFERLLSLSEQDKKTRGIEYIVHEIAQQPEVWLKSVEALRKYRDRIKDFVCSPKLNQKPTLLLCGAGSSEFIGNSIQSILRKRLECEVLSIPTTYLVTHLTEAFLAHKEYIVISFSRSGSSPESIATFNMIRKHIRNSRQIVITSNEDSELAELARKDAKSFCLVLPKETNDKALAMTSSFTTMALTGIGISFIDSLYEFSDLTYKLAEGAKRIMHVYGDMLFEFTKLEFSRACFLGSNTLFGAIQECALKIQEMTAGKVVSMYNSYLGLRHGPQVFINKECVVVAFVSSNSLARKYEIDMLDELNKKDQGLLTIIICSKSNPNIDSLTADVLELFPSEKEISDDFRIMTDVVVGQILATFKSMHLGLNPDNPSLNGIINRVVQGVKIYDDYK